jgi:hypothetical protein
LGCPISKPATVPFIILFLKKRAAPIALMLFLLWPGIYAAQTDTFYVKSYYNSLVPRFLYSYKNQITNFTQVYGDTAYSRDHFTTGHQNFMGGDLSYKWVTIGYNSTFNKENSSNNTDLRFATSYRPVHVQLNYSNLKNLNYFRLNTREYDGEADTVFVSRERKIELRNFGMKVEYIFNHRRFCYSSAYSQGGKQLRSQGSFIVSSGLFYQNFDLRGLSDSSQLKFTDRYGANRFKSGRMDIGVGYAYNWVIKKCLVLAISEIPNIGFQHVASHQGNFDSRERSSVSFTNYVRSGLIYTFNRYFAGAYLYNTVTASKWNGFNYSNVYTSFQLYLGLVLDTPEMRHRNHVGG